MEAVRESLRDEALRRAVVRAVRAEDLVSEAQCVQVRKLVLQMCVNVLANCCVPLSVL